MATWHNGSLDFLSETGPRLSAHRDTQQISLSCSVVEIWLDKKEKLFLNRLFCEISGNGENCPSQFPESKVMFSNDLLCPTNSRCSCLFTRAPELWTLVYHRLARFLPFHIIIFHKDHMWLKCLMLTLLRRWWSWKWVFESICCYLLLWPIFCGSQVQLNIIHQHHKSVVSFCVHLQPVY